MNRCVFVLRRSGLASLQKNKSRTMASLITGNKFDPNTDIPDLTGKSFIVTGGTAGIGFGISAHLLQHGASKIILLGKKAEHGEEAQEALRKYGDVSKVEFKQCELESLKHTDEVAKGLASSIDSLDGLILNAGVGVGPYSETTDGINSHMQVNLISQHHLALTLLPQLLRTPNSRLVLQSSDLHRMAPSDTHFASVEELNRDIGPAMLYNRSKLAQILWVQALVARLEQGALGADKGTITVTGPWVNATHPGAVSTDQQEQAVDAYGTIGKIGVAVARTMMKDPVDEGCRPILFAATSQDISQDAVQGKYIVPDKKITDPSKQASDSELSEKLWALSTKIIADKIGKQSYMDEATAV